MEWGGIIEATLYNLVESPPGGIKVRETWDRMVRSPQIFGHVMYPR